MERNDVVEVRGTVGKITVEFAGDDKVMKEDLRKARDYLLIWEERQKKKVERDILLENLQRGWVKVNFF